MPAFYNRLLQMTAALLLITVVSGCSRMRGAKLYITNDGARPRLVRLRCAEELPGPFAVQILLPPHTERQFKVSLEKEKSYELEVFNTGESSTSLAITQNLLEEADGGEIDVVLGGRSPRLTANPDRDLAKAQRAAFRFATAFLAAFASVVYWSKYWNRRRVRV